MLVCATAASLKKTVQKELVVLDGLFGEGVSFMLVNVRKGRTALMTGACEHHGLRRCNDEGRLLSTTTARVCQFHETTSPTSSVCEAPPREWDVVRKNREMRS